MTMGDVEDILKPEDIPEEDGRDAVDAGEIVFGVHGPKWYPRIEEPVGA